MTRPVSSTRHPVVALPPAVLRIQVIGRAPLVRPAIEEFRK
jgi:hypothetical protein